jgi:hypothetical protein
MHDARGNDPQCQLPLTDDDRVARVISAREPRNDVVIARIEIDDAAFALVAPLQSNDDVGFTQY